MFLRLGTALLFVAVAAPAGAHEWYPIECCSGYDCAAVEQTKISDGAELIVTSKHGTGVVPEPINRRPHAGHLRIPAALALKGRDDRSGPTRRA